MKKFIPLVLLIGTATCVQAQTVIKAGTIQVGGNISYYQQTNNGPYTYYNGSGSMTTTQHASTKSFSVTPSAGYFVADNLAVGFNFLYSRINTNNSFDSSYLTGNNTRQIQTSVGPFLQYYHMFTDHFGLVGTLNATYNHFNQDYPNSAVLTTTYKGNGFGSTLIPSLVFFPVPKFALGASIGGLSYTHTKGKSEGNGVTTDTGSSSIFGATLGLNNLAFSGTYFFGR
jgi:hypothetical protein